MNYISILSRFVVFTNWDYVCYETKKYKLKQVFKTVLVVQVKHFNSDKYKTNLWNLIAQQPLTFAWNSSSQGVRGKLKTGFRHVVNFSFL